MICHRYWTEELNIACYEGGMLYLSKPSKNMIILGFKNKLQNIPAYKSLFIDLKVTLKIPLYNGFLAIQFARNDCGFLIDMVLLNHYR